MAPCKSSNDGARVHVPATSLPIVCKLQNPPANVTGAGAEYNVSGSSVPCTLIDNQSFTFPTKSASPPIKAGMTVLLEVRIEGPWNGSTPVWVVEDCDGPNPTIILVVTSATSKLAQVPVMVE
jgi:hypothetical protein